MHEKSYADKFFDSLLDKVIEGNPSYKQAVSNIDAKSKSVDIAIGNLFPQVVYTASNENTKYVFDNSSSRIKPYGQSLSVQANILNYSNLSDLNINRIEYDQSKLQAAKTYQSAIYEFANILVDFHVLKNEIALREILNLVDEEIMAANMNLKNAGKISDNIFQNKIVEISNDQNSYKLSIDQMKNIQSKIDVLIDEEIKIPSWDESTFYAKVSEIENKPFIDNIDIKISKLSTDAAKLQVQKSKALLLPKLEIIYKISQGNYDYIYGSTSNNHNYGKKNSVTAQITVPLFNGFTDIYEVSKNANEFESALKAVDANQRENDFKSRDVKLDILKIKLRLSNLNNQLKVLEMENGKIELSQELGRLSKFQTFASQKNIIEKKIEKNQITGEIYHKYLDLLNINSMLDRDFFSNIFCVRR